MRIVILVPRRADGGERDESWAWIRARWEADFDWPIIEGHHDEPDDARFNRSRAVNWASEQAGDWDVAVIADADSFCSTEQVRRAVNEAARTGLFTIAFDRFCYISRDGSRQVMDGYSGSWEKFLRPSRGGQYSGQGGWTLRGACSSMLAVPRETWDAVGGFDEGFEGWGWQDVAFSLAVQTLAPRRHPEREGLVRIPGDCWHLWHPIDPTNTEECPTYAANKERCDRYAAVAHQPEKMLALLQELGVRR